jgi:radical SAM protein with 4Fe4S-binding SPASM domain
VRYAAVQCGHFVDLYTNAWKFPRKFAESIKQINEGETGYVRIQMSIEGAGGQTNDMIRGVGTFSESLKSLQMFKELGLAKDIILFACATIHNIHEIDAIIKIAEEHGVGQLVFSQWQRQGNAENIPWSSVAPSIEDWVRAGEKILSYNNPNLRLFGNFHGDIRNTPEGRLNLDSSHFPKHIFYCNSFPRITPQGDILADQLWVSPDWFLGNIKQGTSLEQTFKQSKFHSQLDLMRDRTKHIDECRACRWHDVCEGGSPGHTYAEYGHMNAKDLFCDARMYWFDRYIGHWSSKILGPDACIVE